MFSVIAFFHLGDLDNLKLQVKGNVCEFYEYAVQNALPRKISPFPIKFFLIDIRLCLRALRIKLGSHIRHFVRHAALLSVTPSPQDWLITFS